MYHKQIRIFGPKSSSPYYSGNVIQRGEGFGSFFSKLIPLAKQGFKALTKSKAAKDIGNVLLNSGTELATNVISDLVEGKDVNAKERAKKSLKSARREIANVIRSRTDNANYNDHSKSPIPMKKRKKIKIKTRGKKNKNKRFSIFNDFEDVL